MRLLILTLAIGSAALALAQVTAPMRSSLGEGYLPAGAAPDSVALVPPPPLPGSPAAARDEAAAKEALSLRGTPRWKLAIADAELREASATAAMSCAAGFRIGPTDTPATDRLLRRAAADLGLSTAAAKRHYKRARPFTVNGAPVCTPDMESVLRADFSYPSGHAAIGYGWGLILAELVPDRTAHLVMRGRAFADSRRVCNVHWLSDTEEARNVAAAMVARLHAEPAFVADLDAAKREIAALKKQPADCAADAALR
jgi:acid phosphatase (class A)